MALVFQDSFSTWGNDSTSRTNMINSPIWLGFGAGIGCTTTYPRASTHCLYIPYGSAGYATFSLGKRYTASDGYFGIEFALRLGQLPTPYTSILGLYNSAGQNPLNIYLTQTGAISVNGELSASGLITPNVYKHIGIKILTPTTPSSTDGVVVVRVDNKPAVTVSGADFFGGDYANFESATFVPNFNTPGHAYVTDLVVWDSTGSYCNDWIGNKASYVYFPASDTSSADWSIHGVTQGFDAINDTSPDGDTTYLAASTVNAVSKFGLPTVLSTLTGIKAVTVQSAIRQASAGTSELRVSLQGTTSTTNGTSRVPPFPGVSSSTYTAYQDHFYQDPDGAGNLTPAIISALKLKLERTA